MLLTPQTSGERHQAGFTLVELAIVLVIIGLLLGGILKGQELITATRINSTAALAKSLESGAYTFQDLYGSLPGDLTNAANRITGCAAAPCTVGDGDGALDNNPSVAVTGLEGHSFFHQMYRADIISGLDGQNNVVPGQGLPSTPLDPQVTFKAGFAGAVAALVGATAPNFRQGHYLTLTTVTGAMAGGGGNIITPKMAEGIDRKIDDGLPQEGRVVASTAAVGAAVANCVAAATVYNSASPNGVCSSFIRIMQ